MEQIVIEIEDSAGMSGDAKLKNLYSRRALVLYCIRIISDVDPNDPRKEDALKELNRQKASIDAKIAAIEGKPPATVIGLKPGVVFPKAQGAIR